MKNVKIVGCCWRLTYTRLTSRDHDRKTDWFYARTTKHRPRTCNRRTSRTESCYRRSCHREEPPRRSDNRRRRRCPRNRDRHDDGTRNEGSCTVARSFCWAGSEGPSRQACNRGAEVAWASPSSPLRRRPLLLLLRTLNSRTKPGKSGFESVSVFLVIYIYNIRMNHVERIEFEKRIVRRIMKLVRFQVVKFVWTELLV